MRDGRFEEARTPSYHRGPRPTQLGHTNGPCGVHTGSGMPVWRAAVVYASLAAPVISAGPFPSLRSESQWARRWVIGRGRRAPTVGRASSVRRLRDDGGGFGIDVGMYWIAGAGASSVASREKQQGMCDGRVQLTAALAVITVTDGYRLPATACNCCERTISMPICASIRTVLSGAK